MAEEPYKIRVVGVGGVGKSALTIRFIKGEFDDSQEYIPTIEDSYTKDIEIDGKEATLDILDTAGQEEYAALRDTYMKGGEGFLLVYSITEKSSLDDLNEFYQQILMVKSADQVPMVLVGNKCDLENERDVDEGEGQRVAQDWRIPYKEASAKENIAVEEVFVELVREIQRDRQRKTDEAGEGGGSGGGGDTGNQQGGGGCCVIL